MGQLRSGVRVSVSFQLVRHLIGQLGSGVRISGSFQQVLTSWISEGQEYGLVSVSTSPSPHGSVRVRSRVYFSTRSTRKKMKTVGNLRVKYNGDG